MKLIVSWLLGIAVTALLGTALIQVGRTAVERAWKEHPDRFLTAAERAEAIEFEERRMSQHQRVIAKSAVADAVSHGELGLLEAARRFRELTMPDEPSLNFLRRLYPNMSDDEMFCRHLIGYAEMALVDKPEEAKALATRLNQELNCYLKNGPVCLEPPG